VDFWLDGKQKRQLSINWSKRGFGFVNQSYVNALRKSKGKSNRTSFNSVCRRIRAKMRSG